VGSRPRPIRFGTGLARPRDRVALVAAARKAEALGYSTFGMPDHLTMPFAPLIALEAVAEATNTIRITQIVLNQDLRHPAVLAKELATLDVLSDGRLEVGIGAGWMRSEYEQVGIPFTGASARIARLEEVVAILKGCFEGVPFNFRGRHFAITELTGTPTPIQRPRPPIMIGGGGPRLLSAAARHADIIQVIPRNPGEHGSSDLSEITARSYREKLELIEQVAGQRFEEIELGALLLNVTVTKEPAQAAQQFLTALASRSARTPGARTMTEEDVLSSPVVAIGSLEQVCEKLLETRDAYGISYFVAPVAAAPESLAPVIERLAGA